MTTDEASRLIEGFEDGTWPAKEWTHQAHFVMALWYTFHYPLSEARSRIKEGIKKYNLATGGQNTEDAGYHETITEFYIRTVVNYLLEFGQDKSFFELLGALEGQPFVAKEFPFRFYSKERLMSREARARWVEPDLQPRSVLEWVTST